MNANNRAAAPASAQNAAEAKSKGGKKNLIIGLSAAVVAALLIILLGVPAVRYNTAVKNLANGDYDAAIATFKALDDYKDSALQLKNAIKQRDYAAAKELLAAGEYDAAIAAFEALGNYKDSVVQIEYAKVQAYYAEGEQLLAQGNKAGAAIAFSKCSEYADYKDARERCLELWNEAADRETVTTTWAYTVGLKSDGTVVSVGDNEYGECEVYDWEDMVLPAK